MTAEYRVLIRHPRTLAFIAELPTYEDVRWTRRDTSAGDFSLTVPRTTIDASWTTRYNIVEILRNNVHEFAGPILGREYTEPDMWKLAGPDCKWWWLSSRQVIPAAGSEFDSQDGVAAETAMLHYINAHLISPTDSSRAVSGEIETSWLIGTDNGRGDLVYYDARYERLFDVVEKQALAGGIWHELIIDTVRRYDYRIREYLDRTEGSANPIVFAITQDNIAAGTYKEDAERLMNAVYVLGDGEGANREVEEVTDPSDIVLGFRREASLDSRDATSGNALTQAGTIAIAESIRDLQTATFEPLLVGNTLYRDNFDLGDEITVKFPDINEQVDRRVVEVSVQLMRSSPGEKITIRTGHRPQTLMRIVGELTKRVRPAQVV